MKLSRQSFLATAAILSVAVTLVKVRLLYSYGDFTGKLIFFRTLVVAQLVERSLPSPEVRGLNPVNGKIYFEHLLSTVNCIEEKKIKKKRPEMAHLKKLIFASNKS